MFVENDVDLAVDGFKMIVGVVVVMKCFVIVELIGDVNNLNREGEAKDDFDIFFDGFDHEIAYAVLDYILHFIDEVVNLGFALMHFGSVLLKFAWDRHSYFFAIDGVDIDVVLLVKVGIELIVVGAYEGIEVFDEEKRLMDD